MPRVWDSGRMKDFTDTALETCRREGATYADVRIVTVRGEDITVKDGNIRVRTARYWR